MDELSFRDLEDETFQGKIAKVSGKDGGVNGVFGGRDVSGDEVEIEAAGTTERHRKMNGGNAAGLIEERKKLGVDLLEDALRGLIVSAADESFVGDDGVCLDVDDGWKAKLMAGNLVDTVSENVILRPG
jgi:hypothetical protein